MYQSFNYLIALNKSFRQATGANDSLQKVQSDRYVWTNHFKESLPNDFKEAEMAERVYMFALSCIAKFIDC